MKSPIRTSFLFLFVLSALLAFQPAFAKSSTRTSKSSSHKSASSSSRTNRTTKVKAAKPARIKVSKQRKSKVEWVGSPRDSKGRIKRSESAKNVFKRSNPCPATGKTSGPCKGYVIDHMTPLSKGGQDSPSNMQWQTKEAAKQKDKWERKW